MTSIASVPKPTNTRTVYGENGIDLRGKVSGSLGPGDECIGGGCGIEMICMSINHY